MAKYLDDGSIGLVQQPQNQVAFVAQIVTTGATNTTPYGFTTAAQANNIVAALNSVILACIASGMMKSS